MKNCRGFTLLEMILVIGLMAVVTTLKFFDVSAEMEQAQARATGSLLFTYNNAVRSWVSKNPGAVAAVHSGTKWLKLPACGGSSSIAYLPCDFPDANAATPIKFGNLSLSSTVATSGSSPNQVTTVTTLTSSFQVEGKQRSDLSGLAAITAASGSSAATTPVLMATDGKYSSSPLTSVITMVASSNAPTDAWLRTDGSNTMDNNINFNPANDANHRQLLGVSRIQSLAAQAFYIGANGGALLGQAVVVDADQNLLGSLTVQNVAGDANAITVARGDVTLNSGNLDVKNGYVNAAIFYDANNSSYYVDPSSSTVLNALNVKGNTTLAITAVKGTLSVDGALSAGGRASFEEYISLSRVSADGADCSPNGLVSRDADGKLLSCQSGKWRSGASLEGSAASNGWAEIGGGMMIQWGMTDSPLGRNDCSLATFSRSFDGSPFSATATPFNAGTGTNDSLTTQSYSPSSMVVCQTGYADSGARYATYLVVGRKP
ncbi:shufflon system plasmid conjugative transfer pilus tip adhesin PilV [Pseudomonas taiwanensis]|uniref:shufflon system plasmid conjugative transfer pilus tip adhesin PilV n=1 Tax=Pseudomonas taiwanensis TaxID=470150 RepID=UPI0028DD43AD|nr:shufflon system plasmid conjugative transfer pilus tip adhesin PilV [Pseudomonas taiwanensis]MDT8925067.1 shufflon system plasmid conjugative transfer pilus tip adhesin PilV [Pseudomonas taiwanensis]